jgi:AraC family transcriptional regulator, transcriptional activator of pobA
MRTALLSTMIIFGVSKQNAMKETTIIPQLNFQSKSLPFKVQTIRNFAETQDDTAEAPHNHNYYELIWLTKGNAVLRIDMQEYAVGSNTIFCVMPNQTHQFNIEPGMEGFIFSFTDSFFKTSESDFDLGTQAELLRLFSKDQSTQITDDAEEDIKAVVLKMIKEFDSWNGHCVQLLKEWFKIFLIYLAKMLDEHVQSAENSREAELAGNFMELLDKEFKEKKMVAEYAAQLLVTPNHLNRVVKKITGMSAGHQIRQRVVLEAKRMGRYSGAGMKEIAYQLGFLDIAHFSRFFKTFSGANFSDFKKGAFVVPLNAGFHRA